MWGVADTQTLFKMMSMEEEKFHESEMNYTFILSLCVYIPTGKTNTPAIVTEKRVIINVGVFQTAIISSMYVKETAPKSVYFHCFSHFEDFFVLSIIIRKTLYIYLFMQSIGECF